MITVPRSGVLSPHEAAEKAARIASVLPEPFTAAALAVAVGCQRRQAASYLSMWLERGWLRRRSPGCYCRTKNFGSLERRHA